jgi:ubiquinone biosynthesis monooxygenase Coq7
MVCLPGDLKLSQSLEQIIRVNHAGEFGAKRIYAGQMLVLKGPEDQQLLKNMAAQEEVHLEYFTQEMQKAKIRPSVLLPVWNVLGYALGAGTALLGKTSAMVCTEAVEEVINEHYKSQLKDEQLPKDLASNIEKFRQEELEHQDIAENNRGELNIGHKILYNAIKLGCKISIEIAKRF